MKWNCFPTNFKKSLKEPGVEPRPLGLKASMLTIAPRRRCTSRERKSRYIYFKPNLTHLTSNSYQGMKAHFLDGMVTFDEKSIQNLNKIALKVVKVVIRE